MADKVGVRFARGVRTSIEENSTAYGYSVMISATFGALNVTQGTPNLPSLFLFVIGAALGFTIMEAVSTEFFRKTDRESDFVALLGAAFNFVSMTAGLGVAAAVATVTSGWLAWLGTPTAATAAYLALVGLEISLAKRTDEKEGD